MTVSGNHRYLRVLSILLIVVMGAFVTNKVIYTHIHVLPDGSVFTHAHPFAKSTENQSGPTHHHSKLILFLLDQMELLILAIAAIFFWKQNTPSLTIRVPVTKHLIPAFVLHPTERAPPARM